MQIRDIAHLKSGL